MHSQSRSPCALAAALHDTDVLVTAHGFQSMLLLFLPLPSLLFEIYPYRYYKPAYGPLSKEYGACLVMTAIVPSSAVCLPDRYWWIYSVQIWTYDVYLIISLRIMTVPCVAGILHSCVMSPPQSWWNSVLLKGVPTAYCMLTKTCREFARSDDVE